MTIIEPWIRLYCSVFICVVGWLFTLAGLNRWCGFTENDNAEVAASVLLTVSIYFAEVVFASWINLRLWVPALACRAAVLEVLLALPGPGRHFCEANSRGFSVTGLGDLGLGDFSLDCVWNRCAGIIPRIDCLVIGCSGSEIKTITNNVKPTSLTRMFMHLVRRNATPCIDYRRGLPRYSPRFFAV